jgi:hypothetical protein
VNLLPHEAGVVRQLLTDQTPPDAIAVFALLIRLNAEAPPLGEHVFQVVCKLGTDAAKEIAENTKVRRGLREQLGKKRLSKGEGPTKVVPLAAPTLNEYNAMEPWRKEALRKEYDKEIARLRVLWPKWSCDVIERVVASKGGKAAGKERVLREGGRQRVVLVTRESSVRPDELALDSIGGKIPIDRLVQGGVLRGDTLRWLIRYGTWKEAPPGEGRVVVDVYEVGRC